MAVFRDTRSRLTNKEVEVSAFVCLQDVLLVRVRVATFGDGMLAPLGPPSPSCRTLELVVQKHDGVESRIQN